MRVTSPTSLVSHYSVSESIVTFVLYPRLNVLYPRLNVLFEELTRLQSVLPRKTLLREAEHGSQVNSTDKFRRRVVCFLHEEDRH